MSDLKNDPDADPARKARIRSQINENLRRVYQETLAEEVPDRFHALLAQLRDKDRGVAGEEK